VASKQKDLYIIRGGTHLGMYGKPDLAGAAMSKLASFYKASL
jgi:hypothetical protein